MQCFGCSQLVLPPGPYAKLPYPNDAPHAQWKRGLNKIHLGSWMYFLVPEMNISVTKQVTSHYFATEMIFIADTPSAETTVHIVHSSPYYIMEHTYLSSYPLIKSHTIPNALNTSTKMSLYTVSTLYHPLSFSWRNGNVIRTPKRRHDVILTSWCIFYVIMTLLLRPVYPGITICSYEMNAPRIV